MSKSYQVRNESADDFYALIKEWKKLCKKYVGKELGCRESNSRVTDVSNSKRKLRDDRTTPHGEYEVSHLVDICYGDPTNLGKRGLKFKVCCHSSSSKTTVLCTFLFESEVRCLNQ